MLPSLALTEVSGHWWNLRCRGRWSRSRGEEGADPLQELPGAWEGWVWLPGSAGVSFPSPGNGTPSADGKGPPSFHLLRAASWPV